MIDDEIEEVLAAHGLHAGYPRVRRQLASDLVVRGLDKEKVERLLDWARDQKPRSAGAFAATLLADEARAAEVLTDLLRLEELRKRGVRPGDRYVPTPFDERPELERACIIAACVDNDRRELGDVAAEFNLDPADARDLLEAGRDLRERDRSERRARA